MVGCLGKLIRGTLLTVVYKNYELVERLVVTKDKVNNEARHLVYDVFYTT